MYDKTHYNKKKKKETSRLDKSTEAENSEAVTRGRGGELGRVAVTVNGYGH